MIYPLTAAIQPYAWGGYHFLKEYLAGAVIKDKEAPLAELWYGDHPNAPSLIEGKPLNQWLKSHLDILTLASKVRYGEHLPFLLKLLDVRLPLSIQVHPNKAQAEAGYAKEEQEGKPLSATDRLYRDDNHKPEMMIALSDFWLLHGFTTVEVARQRLSRHPSLKPVVAMLNEQPLAEVYAKLMKTHVETLQEWLMPVIEQVETQDLLDPDYWLRYTFEAMEMTAETLDAGLLCFYLFNIVQLKKGEGVFQMARLPHAYLRGQNIELMAASDNVLRAGLTPKYVAIDELLKIIKVESIEPVVVSAMAENENVKEYAFSVDDFTLADYQFSQSTQQTYSAEQASILLLLEGELSIQAKENALVLKEKGDAVLIPAGEHLQLQTDSARWVIASH